LKSLIDRLMIVPMESNPKSVDVFVIAVPGGYIADGNKLARCPAGAKRYSAAREAFDLAAAFRAERGAAFVQHIVLKSSVGNSAGSATSD
jgi:hypothetical protein